MDLQIHQRVPRGRRRGLCLAVQMEITDREAMGMPSSLLHLSLTAFSGESVLT